MLTLLAKIAGFLMNGISIVLNMAGILNISVSIFIFILIMNLLMLPLTLKMCRFTVMAKRMAPELTKIKDKYHGKTDSDSVYAQNQEINAVYKKYNCSSGGRIFQIIIQLVVLLAMYRVAGNVTAYVPLFQGNIPESAFLLFGLPVNELTGSLFKEMPLQTGILLTGVFLTSFTGISKKLFQNIKALITYLVSSLPSAVFWTFIATKMPVGLGFYWICSSMIQEIIRRLATGHYEKEEIIDDNASEEFNQAIDKVMSFIASEEEQQKSMV